MLSTAGGTEQVLCGLNVAVPSKTHGLYEVSPVSQGDSCPSYGNGFILARADCSKNYASSFVLCFPTCLLAILYSAMACGNIRLSLEAKQVLEPSVDLQALKL